MLFEVISNDPDVFTHIMVLFAEKKMSLVLLWVLIYHVTLPHLVVFLEVFVVTTYSLKKMGFFNGIAVGKILRKYFQPIGFPHD